MATALEARGHDLRDSLWSARVLLEAPESVRAVHFAFLAAGADCIATVTYQATFQGFRARGLSEGEAVEAFEVAVQLAVEARDGFWREPGARAGRIRPLVAASVGPYGAFLADGSEYRGDYGLSVDELADFHRGRWTLLAASRADLLACETIPSALEAQALLLLLDETPDRWAWLSFQCRDERHLADGTPLGDMAELCAGHPRVAGVGVNCVPPRSIPGLLEAMRGRVGAGRTPLIVYPNSGELYDSNTKSWEGGPGPVDLGDRAPAWLRQGATVVGGCCRTSPDTIGAMRGALVRRA